MRFYNKLPETPRNADILYVYNILKQSDITMTHQVVWPPVGRYTLTIM